MFFGTVERPPRLSEFEFEIPEKLIAQNAPKTRDKCKLMVVDKETGEESYPKPLGVIEVLEGMGHKADRGVKNPGNIHYEEYWWFRYKMKPGGENEKKLY